MEREESRKGPWTEEEDLKLVYYVKILGDRRWDFVAKVSGLNRSGKSCRLRWVNYLHPDLKRGKITPQEEQLILELQSRWGNRWSRIARKLPGRTDNEIKNYWRTLMRKKAQERKRTSSTSLTSSSSCCSSSKTNIEDQRLHDKGSCSDFLAMRGGEVCEEGVKGYSMDQIWEEIASSEEVTSGQQGCNFFCSPMASPLWDCSDSLWRVDEEEIKMLLPIRSDLYLSNYEFGRQKL